MKPDLNTAFDESIVTNPKSLYGKFQPGKPFKHLVLSNFFSKKMATRLLDNLPVPPDFHSLRNEFGGKNSQHSCTNVRSLGETYCDLEKFAPRVFQQRSC